MKRNDAPNVGKATVTIGVMGAGPKNGTTHTTILLATYLAAVKGCRVAVAEFAPEDSLRQALEVRNSLCLRKRNRKNLFEVYGLSKENELPQLLTRSESEQYHYVLIDCGNAVDETGENPGRRIFPFCNHRIIVANLSWWRLAECTRLLEERRKAERTDDIIIAGFNATKQAVHYLHREFHVQTEAVPAEPDPFCLHEETLSFCHRLAAAW